MIDVVVDRFDTDEGLLILSLKGAAVEANWENLRKGLIVEARVTKTNKGGLDVDVDGIRGFLPIGQIDINRVEDASSLRQPEAPRHRHRGQPAREEPGRLAPGAARARARRAAREDLGDARGGPGPHGVVRSVKEFGAFVDLGGVDGLLHVAEMSWARIGDPAEVLKVGQEVAGQGPPDRPRDRAR